MDFTALKALSNQACDKDNARFSFFAKDGQKVLCSASTLEDLYECVQKIDPDDLLNHVCTCEDSDGSLRDLAFWVHYILADSELSMKIYTAAENFADNPEKLKVELLNLIFTRLLNYSEISFIPD